MKALLLTLILAATPVVAEIWQPLSAHDIAAVSSETLIDTADSQHPVVLYLLAARLLDEGREQEAANWMYVAQLRYRLHLQTSGDADDKILFSALHEQVGRAVNETIGANVDEWIAAIQWALDWDAAHENAHTSKTEHAHKLRDQRKGMTDLARDLDQRRDEIPLIRAKNGLPNR